MTEIKEESQPVLSQSSWLPSGHSGQEGNLGLAPGPRWSRWSLSNSRKGATWKVFAEVYLQQQFGHAGVLTNVLLCLFCFNRFLSDDSSLEYKYYKLKLAETQRMSQTLPGVDRS